MKQNNAFHNVLKRIPYSTTSIDHQNILSITKRAGEFEKKINKKISQFESQNINVSTCPEYFENMVDEYTATLLSKLEAEYIKNIHAIEYLFRKRASDKIEFQELLERLELEITSTEEEYKVIKKMVDEQNPLTNKKISSPETTN